MKKLLFVGLLLFVSPVFAQNPTQPNPNILSTEEAIGAEMGTILVKVGVYRTQIDALRRQVNDLASQLALSKADADALRKAQNTDVAALKKDNDALHAQTDSLLRQLEGSRKEIEQLLHNNQ